MLKQLPENRLVVEPSSFDKEAWLLIAH